MKANTQKGQAAAFTADDVVKVRAYLEVKGRVRDLALFEVAISTALRTSDVLALTAGAMLDGTGAVVAQIVVKQGKTGGKVVVPLSERARTALARLIEADGLAGDAFLFADASNRRAGANRPLTGMSYRRLVKTWAAVANRDPAAFSGHSTRRTRAAAIYKATGNVEAVRQILGHSSIANTSIYLGLATEAALEIARACEL